MTVHLSYDAATTVGARTFVIAELGSCHDMSLDKAKQLVDAAKAAGADAAKVQFWSNPKRMAVRRHAPQYEAVYQRFAIPESWLAYLRRHCEDVGIEFMCSSYLPEDVDLVAEYVRTMKIASFEANDPVHLAAHVAPVRRGKNLIISCGLGTSRTVIHEYLSRRLHVTTSATTVGTVRALWCVSAYPTPTRELRLRNLWGKDSWMLSDAERIPYSGFSDHSPAMLALTGALAVAAGAEVLERHLRLDTTGPSNPDYPHASPPGVFTSYVAYVRHAEDALGAEASPVAAPSELPMRAYRVRSEDEP